MTTLTDFLLARIAEDEERLDVSDFVEVDSARGPGWGSRGDCPVCSAYQHEGSEAVTEEAWWEHAERTHQRSRVLAECEAKRRIVQEFAKHDERNSLEEQTWQVWHLILRTLAKVYANHPDYDPSWNA